MNNGKISIRYAKALLSSAKEAKVEEKVYSEMVALESAFSQIDLLKQAMSNPTLTKEEKIKLLNSIFNNKTSNLTKSFISLVVDHGREDYFYRIALSYQDLYRKDKNIVVTHLTTAVEADDKIKKQIIKSVEVSENSKVELRTEINPDIIGGYILDIEGKRLDASIIRQLSKLYKYAGH
ncbi:MAG: F0F1 ATP synthase subunit delta [Paludibacteraceae bacterium]|nr:F0F1 ATP synthase subunit delta [Paludibacteraceae bacterium]MBR6686986.1 F0F1 ATP synthase subunit delta [Paludibacteraceae bacterium]